MYKIQIINGPNLNLLGQRDVKFYGNLTLKNIQKNTNDYFQGKVEISWFQSNSESEIINKIHKLYDGKSECLVINPAAFTHTSIAIYDALVDLSDVFKIEVHLSNTSSREDFRKNKITSKAMNCIIEGYKDLSYIIAINSYLLKKESKR